MCNACALCIQEKNNEREKSVLPEAKTPWIGNTFGKPFLAAKNEKRENERSGINAINLVKRVWMVSCLLCTHMLAVNHPASILFSIGCCYCCCCCNLHFCHSLIAVGVRRVLLSPIYAAENAKNNGKSKRNQYHAKCEYTYKQYNILWATKNHLLSI